ncbi:uncharacterized protein LOC127095575 [Lathyrus oleraceus]|uniref:uncharacterized protein LOC127095575 n=1 Tax=Pisum sativum TaxID=3888 RepID=UPI0021CE4015|nr:uncharacterized protein LOC127095575 [Pisum sativum]
MVSDSDDEKVYQYAMEMKSTMRIYVEHKGNVQEVEVGDVQEDEMGDVQEDDVDGNEDNGSSEDNDFEVDSLSFDDSEDERALGLDDIFEDHDRTSGVKVTAKKHKITPKKVPIVVDNASSSSGMDNEMGINYSSEELGSSDPDTSDEEKDPKYPRFKNSKKPLLNGQCLMGER